jgi:D-serine deaminase-like pyridoxal phosphate-dependent protein
LLFYPDLIRSNIHCLVQMAGDPGRLRPHVKTHKTREIVHLELEAGITKHKCATIAEAEMLAACGVPDILLAYPLVGPNCGRMARLQRAFPDCRFAVLADHPAAVQALARAMEMEQQHIDVLVDIDAGQHRTGVAAGSESVALYELIARQPGLRLGGIHFYDGHNHQESLADRQSAVRGQVEPLLLLLSELKKKGLAVPRVVVGGTPTFPVFAGMDLPGLECAPGTCVLHDHGYGTRYRDMAGFTPAALLLTRVVSRPLPNRLTLDLGTKAVASDPPAGQRCLILNVPDARAVVHNEEHLVLESPAAERFQPGDAVYAMPTHICPTCALHRKAYVVEEGRVIDHWDIVARDRMLTY